MNLFRVRREQVAAMASASMETFEDNIMGHLRRVWTEETARMTDAELREWVRYGVDRGRHYGIEAELDVARFVDLMFLLDPRFDEDPMLPWASEILLDPALDGRRRVDALMERAREFCNDASRAHAAGQA